MVDKSNLTALVFARGGSKGVLKKNLRELNGCPLIAHAIKCAYGTEYIERVIVSTDSEEIASVARDYGAYTPFMRPAELASDESPELFSWRHAIEQLDDYFNNGLNPPFISIPTTAPLRSPKDIEQAITKYYNAHRSLDMVLGLSESHRNPYLNMAVIQKDNTISIVNQHQAYRRHCNT